ncbi:uncharacterized protein [Paralichthys olivaceus]|uniref:uncharacterized protein isoform X1 n=1 Tax=Paralichthys olivaceus TaxID=8255 RepID=UPI003752877A
MMMFWLLCLMTGSVTCAPVKNAAADSRPQAADYPYWVTWMGPDMGSSSSSSSDDGFMMRSQPDPSFVKEAPAQDPFGSAGFYTGYPYAASPYEAAAPADNYGGVYVNYAEEEPVATQDEDPNAESEAVARYYAAEAPEPVFSDVSDLEPVYSFSSRSRYNRGRAVFSQTRYTPGEPPLPPPMPLSRVRRPSAQSRPADAPAKGGV